MLQKKQIGKFTSDIIQILGLDIEAETPIYIGESNLQHMQSGHPYEYKKYSRKIHNIIQSPDYIGYNKKDSSIEFIKEFSEHIKIAVRVAGDGLYYARSMYSVNEQTSKKLIAIGQWKPLTNNKKK